jgi:hypothetical protein
MLQDLGNFRDMARITSKVIQLYPLYAQDATQIFTGIRYASTNDQLDLLLDELEVSEIPEPAQWTLTHLLFAAMRVLAHNISLTQVEFLGDDGLLVV